MISVHHILLPSLAPAFGSFGPRGRVEVKTGRAGAQQTFLRLEIAADASNGAGDGACDRAGWGAGDGSRWLDRTYHPARRRPPPAQAAASAAAPTATSGDDFLAKFMAECSSLEAQAPTAPPARPYLLAAALGSASHGHPRDQGSGEAKRGRTVVATRANQTRKQRELLLFLAAAAVVAEKPSAPAPQTPDLFDFCLSITTRFDNKHIRSCLASRRSVSDPRALAFLKATAHSMLGLQEPWECN